MNDELMTVYYASAAAEWLLYTTLCPPRRICASLASLAVKFCG